MRAAIIEKDGAAPAYGEFREPAPREGCVFIKVETAGLGGWDVLGAYREGVEYPCVIRGEGVGRAEDGRRVYFGERSVAPFGAFAERTIVPKAEVWDVPDGVDDRTAITMAIAGTGAYWPLETAKVKQGDSALVLGATGVLGQLAVQYLKIMGAKRIVGAGRNQRTLARLKERRLVDDVVQLTGGDDAAALKAAGGDGFDVVLDIVGGRPLEAALKATRFGSRIVTVGVGAGIVVTINLADLAFRTFTVDGTGQKPPSEREKVWRKQLDLAHAHKIEVEYVDYPLERCAEAWELQKSGAYAKILTTIAG